MAEYLLNQKCLERNCIALSQSQASLQLTGISPLAKGKTPLKEWFAAHKLSALWVMGNLLSGCSRDEFSPAIKQT